MSQVLLINGSPHKNGCTNRALQEVADTLRKHGVESEILYLGQEPVAGCIACGHCAETKRCFRKDQVNQVLEKLDQFEALIVGSPVYFAGPSGQICAFLDRLFYCGSARMKGKPAAAVVSCRRGGAATAFDRLNKYFTICNMQVIGSQYWNQVHGSRAEDVEQDQEGLQTMRVLAENMVWALQNLEAGRKNGVSEPQYEARLRTNFVR